MLNRSPNYQITYFFKKLLAYIMFCLYILHMYCKSHACHYMHVLCTCNITYHLNVYTRPSYVAQPPHLLFHLCAHATRTNLFFWSAPHWCSTNWYVQRLITEWRVTIRCTARGCTWNFPPRLASLDLNIPSCQKRRISIVWLYAQWHMHEAIT